ncbi:MAG TPA: MFS transporter [Nocardioidaceae bacterium]|nr:MFS transporter [Nocardioidaceae bacterium]
MKTEPRTGSSLVLLVLAAAQFLMILDSSVMNVSMSQVAEDVNTPITGIQTAITLYTLVMATTMITGGKIGTILGRRRAFGIGLVIYGAGSLTTALAPSLGVLLLGWSLLEGLGAALIMPAIVALVASNFPAEKRAAAYGLVAAAGAMAVAAGPLIGGAVTAFASWRYVFAGEVLIVVAILLFLRKVEDVPAEKASLDWVGSVLSIVSLGLIVYGVLRSSEWGWVSPTPGGPSLLGASPVIWMIGAGLLLLNVFFSWQRRLLSAGREPLLNPDLLSNPQLTGGLGMFFSQFMVQAGVFFALPMFLSVVLALDALQTGLRVFPLSVALLITAAGIPRVRPQANPRRVVRIGVVLMVIGIGGLVGGMDPGANASVVAVPLLLIGAGLGALSSQLGAVTVSSVPDDRSAEVGGLQNTMTNLGASLGTALVGSVLISSLTSAVISGLENNPDVPPQVAQAAPVELASGVPFLSDAQLEDALDEAGVTDGKQAIMDVNTEARLEALRKAFAVAGLLAISSLFFTSRLPTTPPGAPSAPTAPATETAPGATRKREAGEQA